MQIQKVPSVSKNPEYYAFSVDEEKRSITFTHEGKSFSVNIPVTVDSFAEVINIYRSKETGDISASKAEYHVAQITVPISEVTFEEGGVDSSSGEAMQIRVLLPVPMDAVQLRLWPIAKEETKEE